MTRKRPIKLRELRDQLPQAGRIRAGHKTTARNGKQRPTALAKFRFTSSDAKALAKVAELYGGEVNDWPDRSSPDKFEVYTEADEIEVVLPPDALSGPTYELWSGGGCERRCDGEVATVVAGGPEGQDPIEVPCVCFREGVLDCKMTTRLSVVLPNVRFLGTWRLDTHGENAARELPGMVRAVQEVEARSGFVPAILRLEERTEVRAGKRKNFVVPVLGVDATPEELAAGSVRLGIEGGGEAPALGPAPTEGCPGCHSPYSLHRMGCPNEATLFVEAEVLEDSGPNLVLPETVSEPVPRDPELVQEWLNRLTTAQQAKVLLKARKVAETKGWVVPITFSEISLELADEVMGNGTP